VLLECHKCPGWAAGWLKDHPTHICSIVVALRRQESWLGIASRQIIQCPCLNLVYNATSALFLHEKRLLISWVWPGVGPGPVQAWMARHRAA
jgi:hypothetical protein